MSALRGGVAGLGLLCLASVAPAAPATYRCDDRAPLGQLISTPHEAHVEIGTQRWNLARVRESREAIYLGRGGLRLQTRHSDLDFQRPGAPALHCKLVPQGMRPEDLYVPLPASAPAPR
jgi:hypothetical protein